MLHNRHKVGAKDNLKMVQVGVNPENNSSVNNRMERCYLASLYTQIFS